MNITTRRAGASACVAALVVAAPLTLAGTAQAAVAGDRATHISVQPTDDLVRSGQQFVLRGRMTSVSGAVQGATVRVQTLRSGAWEPLSGAVVSTDDVGHYRVRVVLSSGGTRHLRVVGNPRGDRLRSSMAHADVMVKR
jgi:hypothetical protein